MPGIFWIVAALATLASHVRAETRFWLDLADVYAAQDQRLLYREQHWLQIGTRPERWVLYLCPDGEPFARKRVGAADAQPDFDFADGRDGYTEGARGGGAVREIYSKRAGALVRREVRVPADGVIDAGFDAAVRARWEELMRGEVVHLRFLVPSRKRFFPVRVRRTDSLTWNGIAAERLRMRLDAWFAFALPEVTLVYARQDQRLLEFNGTGNIRDARGRNPQVRIVFAGALQPVQPDMLTRVARIPLRGSCRI